MCEHHQNLAKQAEKKHCTYVTLSAKAFWWMMARLAGCNSSIAELAVDFGNNGLWYYDGSSWTKLTTWSPGVLAGIADGLAVDFDTHGLWKYDDSSWTRIASWDPENMDDVDLN